MSKISITEEVQVLRFFETGHIDRVEAVYNIVAEKMRERLRPSSENVPAPRVSRRQARSTRSTVDVTGPNDSGASS